MKIKIPNDVDERLVIAISNTNCFKKIDSGNVYDLTTKDFRKYQEMIKYAFSNEGISDFLNDETSIMRKEKELDEKYENAYFISDLF